ncbi:Pycsar system effector family protein [Streptomyces formicae]
MTQTTNTNTPVTEETLSQARADVSTEIGRTDNQAMALLTAFGIPLAVLVAAVPGRHISPPAAVLVGLGVVGLVAAMVTVLMALRPNLRGNPPGSFLRWADCTPEEVADDLNTDLRVRLQRLVTRSRITRQKYKALRFAIDLTAAALVLLVLGLLVDLAW